MPTLLLQPTPTNSIQPQPHQGPSENAAYTVFKRLLSFCRSARWLCLFTSATYLNVLAVIGLQVADEKVI